MNITYTQKLKDYMTRKGYEHIAIELVDSATSTSGFTDIVGVFVKEKHLPAYEGRTFRRLDGEIGDIIITTRGLEYDDDIELGLRSFFGAKDITFKGIRAYHI